MNKILSMLTLISILMLMPACQNKMTFRLQSIELPNKPIDLPITKDKGLWPTVTININSKKVQLHVDTGGEADAISLTKEQIEKIDLQRLDKTRSTMNAHGEKRLLHYYMAEEVSVDSIRFTNCEIMEMPSPNDKFDNIGIIGFGFLQYFNVYTDFKNNQMKLYPAGFNSLVVDKSWNMIHLDEDNRFKGKLVGYYKEYKIGFDTGAIYVNGKKGYNWIRIDKNKLSDNFDSEIEFDFYVFTANIITAENKKIDNLRFLVYETSEPEDVDIFLGYDFFSKYEVFVDYSASRLYYR